MWSKKAEKSLKYSLKVIEKEGQDKCQKIELERKIKDRNYRFQLFKLFEETSKVNFALKSTVCKNESKPFSLGDSVFKTVNCDLVNFKEDCRNKRFMSKRTGRCKSMPSLHLYVKSENEIHLPLINVDNKVFKTVKELTSPKLIKKSSIEYLGKTGSFTFGSNYQNHNIAESSSKSTPCLEDFLIEPFNRNVNDYKIEKKYQDSSENKSGETSCLSFKYRQCSESKENDQFEYGECSDSKSNEKNMSSKTSEDYKKSNANLGWVDNTTYINRKSNRCTFLNEGKQQLVLPSII
ncbi:uncharacterized protein LOC124817388 [Hydra vulgaris]|uniref:uncharacterized protein LOC124817388 n=1 Tax=Hydra vulgaris TaxID=6087 RepID=UPI001F5E7788|nr:uncharacterized protein LOC124817388 [Hydra vulgaris]